MLVSKKYLTFTLLSMGIIPSNTSFCVPVDTMLKLGAYGIIAYTLYPIHRKIQNRLLGKDIDQAFWNNTYLPSTGNQRQQALFRAEEIQKIMPRLIPLINNIKSKHKLDINIRLVAHPTIIDTFFRYIYESKIFLILINDKLMKSPLNIGAIAHEIGHMQQCVEKTRPTLSKIYQDWNATCKRLYILYLFSAYSLTIYPRSAGILSALATITMLYNNYKTRTIYTAITRYEKAMQQQEIEADTLSAADTNIGSEYTPLIAWFLHSYAQSKPHDTGRSIQTHPCPYIRLQKICQSDPKAKYLVLPLLLNKKYSAGTPYPIPEHIKHAIINNTPIRCCTPYEYVSESHE